MVEVVSPTVGLVAFIAPVIVVADSVLLEIAVAVLEVTLTMLLRRAEYGKDQLVVLVDFFCYREEVAPSINVSVVDVSITRCA